MHLKIKNPCNKNSNRTLHIIKQERKKLLLVTKQTKLAALNTRNIRTSNNTRSVQKCKKDMTEKKIRVRVSKVVNTYMDVTYGMAVRVGLLGAVLAQAV